MKKITIIMMAAGFAFICAASNANAFELKFLEKLKYPATSDTADQILYCEKVEPFFSDNPNDYMVGIELDKTEGKYAVIVYGRLKQGHSFNELISSFKESNYIISNEDKAKFGNQIENEKMLISVMHPQAPKAYVYAANCNAIEKKNPSDRPPFSCKTLKLQIEDGEKDEITLLKELPETHKARYWIADVCRSQAPYQSLAELASNSINDGDDDKDGIPNSFDTSFDVIPKEPEEEPVGETTTEGCVGDRDCDGVTDAMDECPDEAGDLALAGCPPAVGETAELPAAAPTPEEVTPSIPRWYDRGAMCNLRSTANANSANGLSLIAALLALVSRRISKEKL